jgi:hypothetical protein
MMVLDDRRTAVLRGILAASPTGLVAFKVVRAVWLHDALQVRTPEYLAPIAGPGEIKSNRASAQLTRDELTTGQVHAGVYVHLCRRDALATATDFSGIERDPNGLERIYIMALRVYAQHLVGCGRDPAHRRNVTLFERVTVEPATWQELETAVHAQTA